MIIERKICFFFRRILYGWQLAWLFDIESGESGMVNAALTAINWTASTCLIFNQRPHTKRMIHYHRHRTQSSSPEWKWRGKKVSAISRARLRHHSILFSRRLFPSPEEFMRLCWCWRRFIWRGNIQFPADHYCAKGETRFLDPSRLSWNFFFVFANRGIQFHHHANRVSNQHPKWRKKESSSSSSERNHFKLLSGLLSVRSVRKVIQHD